MLLTVSLGWALLQLGRTLLSPLLPAILVDLSMSEATAGVALALFQGVYGIAQYPSGAYSDTWSRTALILPGLGLLIVGFTVFGLAGGLFAFFAASILIGFGKGLFATPSRALVSDLFVANRGRALGVYAAGTDLGGLLASGIAIIVLTYATWRAPFVPIAIGLAVLGVLYWSWTKEEYTVGEKRLNVTGTLSELVERPDQRVTLVAFSLFYFMVGGFISFFPTYLTNAKGYPISLASATFAIVFLVGIGIKPIAGGLSDRFPRRLISMAGLLLAAGAMTLLIFANSLPVVVGSVALLALGYKTQFPLADAIIMDSARAGELGANLGAARALFLIANALGPAYVGIVATYASYAAAFGGYAVCLLIAAGLLYWGGEK
ncbi:MFS transporter [Haladaptatus sp. DJG-WS-42]|uniref:MFS transporter n=1 Tax=Haladaptatus sp. DJG-WS-42 TaxID=3120516 RepID=UPI0030D32E1B